MPTVQKRQTFVTR